MAKKRTTLHKPIGDHALSFLSGGGEMARLIQEFDWNASSIGAMRSWPQSLRTSINLALHSPMPIVLLWGPDGTMIYNDAYSVFAGGKHPSLLGAAVVEGWPEVADFNKNVMHKVLRGKSLSYKDQRLTLYRNQKAEDVWMDLNYSPIMNEAGKPAGVIAIVVETTQRVLAEHKQQKAEAALRTERTRLQELFMRAPALVAVLQGADHIYTLANPLYIRTVGGRPILGKTIREALPELAGQGIYEILDTVYKTGQPSYGNEVPVKLDITGDGTVSQRYFNFIYQPYFTDDHQVDGILVHAVDVTDQVVARKEVEEQNKVLKMIASDTSLKDTLDFLMTSTENRSGGKIKASILLLDSSGKHLMHGAAPSLPAAYNQAIDGGAIGPKAGSCGTAAYTKKPVLAADIATDPLWKDYKDLALTHGLKACWSTPILAADHSVLGTFAMYYDEPHSPSAQDKHIIEFVTRTAALIIERKRAEEALIKSEERFRFMAETLPLKIFTTDPAGQITYFNPQWATYIGVDIENLKKNRVLKFLHPDDLEDSMSGWRQAIKDGKDFQNEQRLLRHDGQYRRHVSHVRAMRDSSGKIVSWFGSMTDIEDVLQTAIQNEKLELITTALKEQRAQLLAINKVKDEFIALSSHQLRTPATAVKQYISLVLDGYFGPITPEQKYSLQTAYDSNERQLTIINDLLKTAQLDSSSYNLNKNLHVVTEIMQESISEMKSALDIKKQAVIFRDSSDGTELTVDRAEMKLVFINLLENAIKYSLPMRTITVSVQSNGRKLEISIQDEGVGIRTEDAKRIFEKFTRVNNELSDTVSGTGLGLYWVKRIIKLHHGTITVTSMLGKGSTFTIRLPLK